MKRSIFLTLAVFKVFASGVEYLTEEYDDFTNVHILIVDPNLCDIKAVRANKTEETSLQTVIDMSKEHDAIAGVNGGFSYTNGDPRGVLKCQDIWHGLAVKPRGAIGWDDDISKVTLGRVLTKGDDLSQDIEVLPITPSDWDYTNHIVGGAPMLISDGEIIDDFSPEQTIETFLTRKFSRTAIGILPNGHWAFVVVESNLNAIFGGMTMKELADYMYNLGCVDALNLSGGHSSSFVYEDTLMNKPYGAVPLEKKDGRPVSDCILILKKN